MGTTSVIGSMNIVLGGDGATFSQAIDQAQKQIDKLKGKTDSFGGAATGHFKRASTGAREFGHASVTSVQAASGALRELNGDFLHNLRAVEKFITLIPGVGTALKFAFPLVGGVAFAAMIGENIVNVHEFIKASRLIPGSIEAGFASLNSEMRASNDMLEVENARLDNTLAKLEHRPENGLTLSLAEIVAQANKGTKALGDEILKADELMKKNRVGWKENLLGQSKTEPDAKDITGYNNRISQVSASFTGDIESAASRGEKDNVVKLQQDRLVALEKVYAEGTAKIGDRLKYLQSLQENKAYKAFGGEELIGRINQARGALEGWNEEQKQLGEEYRKGQTEGKIAPLEAAKQNGEASSKAEEKRLKADEDRLAEIQKQTHQYSVAETVNYWSERMSAYRKGSEAYHQILKTQEQLEKQITTSNKQFIAGWKKDRADTELELPKLLNSNAETMRKGAVKDAGEQGQDFLSSNQLALEQARNIAREHEAFLNTQAGRTMTEYAATIERANIHAEEFKANMVALQGLVDTRQTMLNVDPSKENKAQLAKAQRDLEAERSRRGIQMGADDGAIYGLPSSALVGGSDALREFIRSVTDSATEMKHFTEQGLRGFNDALLKVLTGQSGRGGAGRVFQDFGANLFRQGAGSLLQNAEGRGMKMLGLGNGGTAKFLQSHTGGIGGFLAKLLYGGSKIAGGFGADGLGGISSKWLSSGMDALPHFAAGGAIDAATASIIGEKGPELFIPQSAGTIVPNNKLMGGKGGGGDFHYHFDGANFGGADPVMIMSRVKVAIEESHKKAVGNALTAMRERSLRTVQR